MVGSLTALIDINAILGMQNAEQYSVFHCKVLDTA